MTVSGEFGDGSGLVAALGSMISTDGLDDLLAGFDDAGDGEAAQSWLGSGANRPISAGAVERAVGRTRLSAVAAELASSPEHVAEALAVVIPAAIDALTPGGRRPSGAELDSLDLATLLEDHGVDVASLLAG